MAVDERLRRELERAARPADPSGIYEDLIRRRERRRLVHKVGTGALAVVVVLGSIGGLYGLARIFGGSEGREVAAPSVANGEIVFSLPLESGGEHLFSVAPDGTGLRQLTDGDAIHRSPDVSPDGRTVAFSYSVSEGARMVLATMPSDGGPVAWPIEHRYGDVVLDPAWSPDGERIAFIGSVRGRFGIVVFDVQTRDTRLIRGTDDLLIGNPTWSPDGETIAFEGATPDPGNPNRFPWDVYSVRLDGSQLTNLTRTPDHGETSPAWSWATDRIAFIRGPGPSGSGLYTMAPDGTDEVRVFDALPDLDHPAWSPDGRFLAFSADTGQVYTIPAGGGEPTAVVGAMGEPAWRVITGTTPIEPAPSPSTEPSVGEDIGVGFPVCDVTSVQGVFDPGVQGTAFVATRASDTGGCPTTDGGIQLLAVDVDGDGGADVSYGPLECDPFCSAFAAPDVDGDGLDELLVQNVQFSIAGLKLYEVIGDLEIVPITIGASGSEGFEGGTEPQFWVGGDAGDADAIRCEPNDLGTGPARALVSVTSHHAVDSGEDTVVTETTFLLKGTFLSVVDVNEFTWPANDDTRPFLETSGCGADLDPYD